MYCGRLVIIRPSKLEEDQVACLVPRFAIAPLRLATTGITQKV